MDTVHSPPVCCVCIVSAMRRVYQLVSFVVPQWPEHPPGGQRRCRRYISRCACSAWTPGVHQRIPSPHLCRAVPARHAVPRTRHGKVSANPCFWFTRSAICFHPFRPGYLYLITSGTHRSVAHAKKMQGSRGWSELVSFAGVRFGTIIAQEVRCMVQCTVILDVRVVRRRRSPSVPFARIDEDVNAISDWLCRFELAPLNALGARKSLTA